VSRRHTIPAPPPGIIDIPTVKIACSGGGAYHRARLPDLLGGCGIGQRETVLWQGAAPETVWVGEVPVYRSQLRRCGRRVWLVIARANPVGPGKGAAS
jgi:hypothetical protein